MLHLTRSRFLRRFIPGLFSFLCVLILAACSRGNLNGDPIKLSDLAGSNGETTIIRVATAPDFPPFTFMTSDGNLAGFDIDLMNAIAAVSNYTAQFENRSNIDEVIRSLYAGTVDAAIYGLSITPERAKVVSFSRPYFKSGLAIAAQTSNTEIASIDTLQGKRIGVESGSTSEIRARTIPGATVQTFNAAPIALEKLEQGEVDAVINDAPVTAYAIHERTVTGVKLVGDLLSEEFYGIATPKNSPNLETLNAGLATVLENGQYEEIYQKWFTGEPVALPETLPFLSDSE